ncbi:MAG: hypothetical protein HC830_13685 [Bacteroidetes bacterium]|nr:hypothetical protein [Bacteroidota bacterium]
MRFWGTSNIRLTHLPYEMFKYYPACSSVVNREPVYSLFAMMHNFTACVHIFTATMALARCGMHNSGARMHKFTSYGGFEQEGTPLAQGGGDTLNKVAHAQKCASVQCFCASVLYFNGMM